MAEADSTKPLLPQIVSNTVSGPLQPQELPMRSSPSQRRLWPLLSLLVLVHLAQSLYTLPLNRVIELRLCQDHYNVHEPGVFLPDGSIPEKLCKINEVQKQLAWLQGISDTTLVVCDFVVTIPFSFIAEKFGFQIVLWCNLIPRMFMSVWALLVGNCSYILPTRAIIVGPFSAVLGAECVFTSTVFTLTSALTREYVQRASYFSYISSTSYVVSFIGPTLAATTMSWSLWLPFWINIVLLLLAVPAIKMLPEMKRNPNLSVSSTAYVGVRNSEEADSLLRDSPSTQGYSNAFEEPTGLLQNIWQASRKLVGLVFGRRNFQVLLISFFLTALASSDTKLLVQYISKRYEWTFAQAGYMLSAKALVNFTLLAIIVPRLIRASMASQPIHDSEIRLNYLGALVSIGVSVIGVLCVAMAAKFWMLLTALIIYALGSALPVFTMSLVKSPLIALGDSDIQDFSIVMLVKTLGSLVGAPLMTVLWVHAIKIGGVGLGLPYLVSGCIYMIAAFVVARLRL